MFSIVSFHRPGADQDAARLRVQGRLLGQRDSGRPVQRHQLHQGEHHCQLTSTSLPWPRTTLPGLPRTAPPSLSTCSRTTQTPRGMTSDPRQPSTQPGKRQLLLSPAGHGRVHTQRRLLRLRLVHLHRVGREQQLTCGRQRVRSVVDADGDPTVQNAIIPMQFVPINGGGERILLSDYFSDPDDGHPPYQATTSDSPRSPPWRSPRAT